MVLPGLIGSLKLIGPYSFSGDREFGNVYDTCLTICVGKLQHAVPLPLHTTHHCVGGVVFDLRVHPEEHISVTLQVLNDRRLVVKVF